MINGLMSKIILISGPTASGKSSFALKLASKIKGEIINADSMQIYIYICILSAFIISPFILDASFNAKLDFPEAVGPEIKIILDISPFII